MVLYFILEQKNLLGEWRTVECVGSITLAPLLDWIEQLVANPPLCEWRLKVRH